MFVGVGVGVGRQRFAGNFADSYSARVLADGGTIEALSCVAGASALLQTASLLLIPSGYKAGVAYSALPNNGNGDLTWSRNSVANRTQSNGNIGSVGVNVPRLSYMYGSCPSLLLEPQRTNLCLQSNDISNILWQKVNSSATGNSTTSPDGGVNASLISVGIDAAAGRHRIYVNSAPLYTSGVTYTWSIYAKKNAHDWMQMLFQSTTFDIGAWANFDLNNGVVGNTGGAVVTARIQSVGDGWYRCSITSMAALTAVAPTEVLVINNTNGGRYPSYQSLSAQNVFYLWGGQVEVGAYPTTLNVTTTATATRLADTFTRNNIYTNGLISESGGTWYLELKNNVSYTRDGQMRLGIGDTSNLSNNSLYIIPNTVGRFIIYKTIIVSGSPTNVSLYGTLTDNLKLAIKWNGSTADVFVNGVKVVSATLFAITIMEFLNNTATTVPTFIQQMALFNTVLSDSDCQLLTT
jgi:hypothetical protein